MFPNFRYAFTSSRNVSSGAGQSRSTKTITSSQIDEEQIAERVNEFISREHIEDSSASHVIYDHIADALDATTSFLDRYGDDLAVGTGIGLGIVIDVILLGPSGEGVPIGLGIAASTKLSVSGLK